LISLFRGGYFLLDSSTDLLYHDAQLNEWPSLVGSLKRQQQSYGTPAAAGGLQAQALGQDAMTTFFTALDTYLKSYQVRCVILGLCDWLTESSSPMLIDCNWEFTVESMDKLAHRARAVHAVYGMYALVHGWALSFPSHACAHRRPDSASCLTATTAPAAAT
jgi:hypothetical protein